MVQHKKQHGKPLVLVLVLLSIAVFSVSHAAYTEQLIFYDDFNIFDTNTWKHEMTLTGGGNWEFQQYVNNRSISFVDNGVLYIKPMTTAEYQNTDITKEGYTIDLNGLTVPDQCTSNFQWGCSRTTSNGFIVNPITSARIRTAEHFSFKYGRVEIKAKLPRGDWLWPALWMMPSSNRYGPWPASGEIDIMESRGNKDYYAISSEGGIESMASTLHWGPFYGENGYAITRYPYHLKTGRDFADDFHTFGLYWDDKRMYTYVDNESNKVMDLNFTQSFWDKANANGMKWDVRKLFNPWTNAADRAPFNQEFYLIMCLAVGTTNGYFPDTVPAGPNRNYPKPWSNSDEKAFANFWKNRNQWLPSWVGNDTALRIDSVKVWGFKEISTWTIDGVALTGASTSISSLILMIIGIIALVLAALALCATASACAYWLVVPKCVNYVKNWREGRAQKLRERELSESSTTRGVPLADIRAQRALGNTTTNGNIMTSTHHLDTSDEMTS